MFLLKVIIPTGRDKALCNPELWLSELLLEMTFAVSVSLLHPEVFLFILLLKESSTSG